MNKGIMINIDDTHFMQSRFIKNIDVDREELETFVSQYRHTHVTDLVFCAAGRIMCYPSEVSDSYIDKYLQKQENGRAVDYSRTFARISYDMFVNKGLDAYEIWLNECRKWGIRGWLSLRMNDCHDNNLPASVLHPDFYHEHPEYRRVTHRAPSDYFDGCLDYAQEAVRERELKIIDELLTRYDPDGIELDWQREAFCFGIGGEYEGIEILNDFMREVVVRVRRAEEMRGHRILVGVRLPADPQDALDMGFDAATWAQEGLVQVVVPAPRWRTCDSDIPVGMWKRLLRGSGAKLAPGIELLFQPGRCRRMYASVEQVTALAHQHFALGGDMTYLFNYFDDPTPEDSYWSRSDAAHENMAVKQANQEKLLCILGDPDLTAVQERRHVITERDLRPAWRTGGEVLPFTCRRVGRYKQVRVAVGSIPTEAEAQVTLGLSEGAPEDVVLYVNQRRAALVGTTDRIRLHFEGGAYTFRIPNDGRLPPYLMLEVGTSGQPFTVEYIDVHIPKASLMEQCCQL